MPRFSVAFARRKSTADDIENAEVTPPGQGTFRVLERHDYSGVKSFDGGVKMAKANGAMLSKPDFQADDNMFSDMKANRGSGLSNTTHTTSTDTSSRHSNASTAPSSADFSGGNLFHDDNRNGPPKSSSSDIHGRGISNKSIGSKFLDRAGRTFSFGGQKKYSIPPPLEDPPMPDLPPPMPIMAEPGRTGSRGTTTYTQAPTISRKPAPRDISVMDMGGDFGSMFSGSGFDKRASMATLKNDDLASPRFLTGNPQMHHQMPHSPDTATPAQPLLGAWNTPKNDDIGDDYPSDDEGPPPVPNHSAPRYRSPARQAPVRKVSPAEQPPAPARQTPMHHPPAPPQRQSPIQEPVQPEEAQDDEDAKLLQETYTAIQLLSAEDDEFDENPQPGRYRREEDSFTVVPRAKTASNSNNGGDGDELFDGNRARPSKPNNRYIPPPDGAPRNKVMTPAEFEKYREDKIRHDRTNSNSKDDDEDDINYDDDEDEAEKSKQQAKQRRKQEAHMAVYRQQMMKVTGEANPTNGLGIPASMSAPQLSHMKHPSLDPAAASAMTGVSGASDEADDDEEIPLAILQAHGFPNKNRPPTRLSTVGSTPNIRASALLMPGRPSSSMGESAAARRHSTLPAFARNLPQDPFVGASIAQPALRESLSFNEMGMGPKPPSPLPPGGLVGVIASEERQRAMRRGSPSVDPSRLMGSGYNTPGGTAIDPIAGIPAHMMYPQQQMGGGMPGMMPHMMTPPPMLTVGDQAQLQMTQQMSQFMQMQMQFMQMMASNQNGGGPQQQPQQMQSPYQQPYGGLMGNHSMVDISSRNSMIGEQTLEPRRGDYGSMRTMSMVQPNSAPMATPMPHPGYAGSIRSSVHGYTPSIAPSERSNIGLPNRYRPVSQAVNPAGLGHMQSQSFSGALSAFDNKNKTSMRIVNKSASDDDDDEEGWEAMKNKRDKKRSLWRSKKNLSSVI
ncbi:uncharacterized protein TrAFT101_007232 [Trichoderma asperellum]|uniref:Uncharacterized protein n=1 Tax=Trichoderma asperellum (strain ATCC 204424 / CBS 433.97 / NBRC 101777) TaxID=1042311 RepID=A0A2T3YWJ6_TRIA4|nr:hypothetical protein M441DRAFT_72971 [Trichoderma asperellum CBS 433.97]PTB36907.1 hypothetical protein M441DRAFT_72971 [Trichoderma asperellum CBS 433.97]UKZ92271.1 hypothetical protein TrAFT101_007232 [Trichoderma asperellum]